MNTGNIRIFKNKKLFVIFIVFIFLFLLIGYYFFHLYQGIMEDKTKNYAEVKSLAMEMAEVESIDHIERFHGDHLYYVLNATSTDAMDIIVYMYQAEEEWQYKTYNSEQFYSQNEILTEWENRCTSCDLLGASIGIDNDHPLIEIKYMNEEDKLVYEHVLLEDKSYYQLTLNPSF